MEDAHRVEDEECGLEKSPQCESHSPARRALATRGVLVVVERNKRCELADGHRGQVHTSLVTRTSYCSVFSFSTSAHKANKANKLVVDAMILRRWLRFLFFSTSQSQSLADSDEISLALHLFRFSLMQSVHVDENRQSTRIRQWRWMGTWDCGDAWFSHPHGRQGRRRGRGCSRSRLPLCSRRPRSASFPSPPCLEVPGRRDPWLWDF